jgi:hypothetical protein
VIGADQGTPWSGGADASRSRHGADTARS